MALDRNQMDPEERRRIAESIAAARQIREDRGRTIVTRDVDRQSAVEKAANRSYGQISDRANFLQANPGEAANVRAAQQAELRAVAANQRAGEQEDVLMQDFAALRQGTPDEVRDWKGIAEAAVYVSQQDDEDSRNLTTALLQGYGEQLKPHLAAAGAGEDWWEANYVAPEEMEDDSRFGWKSKLGTFGDYIDQLGQSGLDTVAGIRAAIDQDDDISAAEGLQHAVRKGASALDFSRLIPGFDGISQGLQFSDDAPGVIRKNDGTTATFDQGGGGGGEGRLNSREALGLDVDEGGRWGGVLDLIGTMVVDPTSYLTLGASTLARTGLKGADEAASALVAAGKLDESTNLMPLIRQQVRAGGRKSLTAVEDDFLEQMVRFAVRSAKGEGDEAVRVAERQLRAITRTAQDGINFAGRKVIPTNRLTEVLRKAGIASESVFRRAPIPAEEIAGLSDDAAEIADTLMDGPAWEMPALGAGDDTGRLLPDEIIDPADPNWNWQEGIDGELLDGTERINVTTPDGRTYSVLESEMQTLFGMMSDIEAAWMLRNNPQMVQRALPAGRRRVINRLVKDDTWEYGIEGLVRMPSRTATTVDGIAGALPAAPNRLTRAQAARRQRVNPNTRNAPRSGLGSDKLPRPAKAAVNDVVPFTGRETNAGWRVQVPDQVDSLPFTYAPGDVGRVTGDGIERLLYQGKQGQIDGVFARGDKLPKVPGANLTPDEFFGSIMDRADDVTPTRGGPIVPFEGPNRFRPDTQPALTAGTKGGDIVPYIADDLIEQGDEVLEQLDEVVAAGLEIPPALQAAIDNIGERIIDSSFRGGWFAKLMEIPRVARIIKSMNPRSFVTARFGKPVSDVWGSMLSRMKGTGDRAFDDVLLRAGVSMHRASKDLPETIRLAGGETALFRTLDNALSGGREAFEKALADAADNPGLVQMLEVLDGARRDAYRHALRGQGLAWAQVDNLMENLEVGLGNFSKKLGRNIEATDLPTNMHDIDRYMPRVLSGMIRADMKKLEAIKAAGDNATALGARDSAESVVEGFMSKRGDLTDADSIFGANSEARQVLAQAGIDDITEMFEQNPVLAMAVRNRSGYQAAAEVDMLDGMTDLALPGGQRAAYRLTPEQAANDKLGSFLPKGSKISDYRALEFESGVKYYVQKDFAAELENIRTLFGDPKKAGELARMFDHMNNVWAMSATVGLVNPGFHIRNTVGNWFNMILGGVRDPRVMTTAGEYQWYNRRILNEQAASGSTYAAAASKLGIDEDAVRILTGARRTGVLGDSRTLDLSRTTGGKSNQGGAPLQQGLVGADSKLSIASPDSMLNRPGVVLGETVEGNSRLALYIDQINNKGASEIAASDHVKKYLFDYGDLTAFENENVRRLSRFYTFTRKNTALQFYGLTRHPGLTLNTQKAVEGLITGAIGNETEGDAPAPDWMRNPILGRINGTDVAAQIDTPLDSFMDMAGIATAMFAEDDPLKPGSSRLQRLTENLDGLFSGVGVSFADWWQENITGLDSFTGRPLQPPGTMEDGEEVGERRDSGAFRLIDVFFPAASRAERWAAQGAFGDTSVRGGRDQRDGLVNLINILGGITVAELGEDAEGNQRSLLMRQMVEQMDAMRDQFGSYDPETNPDGIRTLTQMRELGDLAIKDRVASAIMYSWSTNADGELVWDDAVRDKKLLDIVPKDVLRAMGVPDEILEAHSGTGVTRPELEEGDIEGQARYNSEDLAAGIAAYEAWRGEPLTEQQKMDFIIASPWAPSNELLESLGIEPFSTRNRFVQGEEEPSYDSRLAEANTILDALATSQGLNPSAFAQYRPRLAEAERVVQEATAAGVPQSELLNYFILGADEGGGGGLSRNDKAYINQLLGFERDGGPIPITTTRRPDVTAEDKLKIQTKAWEAQSELRIISQIYGWPKPTPQQEHDYIMNSIMTGRTLDELGINNLRGAPNREDIRTDEEKYGDSVATYEAGVLGQAVGPGR